MKGQAAHRYPRRVDATLAAQADCSATAMPTVAEIYREHADFVWRCLYRFGVDPNDMKDVLQEVFLEVHKSWSRFEGRSQVSTWLFGIALRVCNHYRRRRRGGREKFLEPAPVGIDSRTPEAAAVRNEARTRVVGILGSLSLEQRAVFVMFELEGYTCQQIAELIGVPLGTVYSRLHAARKAFRKHIRRLQNQEQRGSHG